MSKFNWESLRKDKERKMRKVDWYIKNKREDKPFKDKMDKALKEHGWQKCPRCNGGRHPMFSLCRKCREKQNN